MPLAIGQSLFLLMPQNLLFNLLDANDDDDDDDDYDDDGAGNDDANHDEDEYFFDEDDEGDEDVDDCNNVDIAEVQKSLTIGAFFFVCHKASFFSIHSCHRSPVQ